MKNHTNEKWEGGQFIKLPYVKGLLEKIHTLGKRCKVDTIFPSQNTLRSHLTSNKPKTQHDTKNYIYVIPCEYEHNLFQETSKQHQTCLAPQHGEQRSQDNNNGETPEKTEDKRNWIAHITVNPAWEYTTSINYCYRRYWRYRTDEYPQNTPQPIRSKDENWGKCGLCLAEPVQMLVVLANLALVTKEAKRCNFILFYFQKKRIRNTQKNYVFQLFKVIIELNLYNYCRVAY